MKKFIALCLTLCLALTCLPASALAAETNDVSALQYSTVESVTPRNKDYWNTNGFIFLEGTKQYRFTPGAGESLKVHINLTGGTVKIRIREEDSSFWAKTVTFRNTGHNYADLVKKAKNEPYILHVIGGVATFEGGVYSEP